MAEARRMIFDGGGKKLGIPKHVKMVTKYLWGFTGPMADSNLPQPPR